MNTGEIVAGAVLLVLSILIIIIVLMQDPKDQSGLSGAITGGETYFGQGRGRTRDALLATITKWSAAILFALVIGLNLLTILTKK